MPRCLQPATVKVVVPLAAPAQEDEPPVVGFVVEADSEGEEEEGGEEQAKVGIEVATTEKDKEEDEVIPLGSASAMESAGVIGAPQAPGTIGAGGGNGISVASGNDGVSLL